MKLFTLFCVFYFFVSNFCTAKEVGFIVLNNGKKVYCSEIINIKNKNLKFIIKNEQKVWTIGANDYEYAQLNEAPKQLLKAKKLINLQHYNQALKIITNIENNFYDLGWNSSILKLKAEIYFKKKKLNQAFLQLNKIILIAKEKLADKNLGKNLIYTQKKFWNHNKYSSAKLSSLMLIKSIDLECRIIGYYTLADFYQLTGKLNLASKNYMYAFIIADGNKISPQSYTTSIMKLILQLKRENKDFSQYIKTLKNYSLRMRNNKKVINAFIKEINKTQIDTGLQKNDKNNI